MTIYNIVFQGGSVKGIAYIGAIEKALEQNLFTLGDIKRSAGTSAGAINALVLALGYSIEDMKTLMSTMNFKDFLDERSGFSTRDKLLESNQKLSEGKHPFFSAKPVKTVSGKIGARLINCFGVYDGDFFRGYAENLIIEKTHVKHLTFGELHNLHLQNPFLFKDLYVVGMNLSTGMSETFSYETTPNAIISDAVRISMSIPYIFKPHYIHTKDTEGNRVIDEKCHVYVDGGLLDNYPIYLFDQNKYRVAHTHGDNIEAKVFNDETLGFKLVSKPNKDYFESLSNAPETDIKNLINFTGAIFSAMRNKENSDHARSNDNQRTIYIDTKGVGTLQFDLTKLHIDLLIESGKEAVGDYISRCSAAHNSEAKLNLYP